MQPNRVGVRELRQNLSRYLRRVASGERLEVTEHGKPVAMLGPVDESKSGLKRLVASGRATPPHGDLLDLAPPKGPVTRRGTKALEELREDRL
jgi:prevent-host-death family protein